LARCWAWSPMALVRTDPATREAPRREAVGGLRRPRNRWARRPDDAGRCPGTVPAICRRPRPTASGWTLYRPSQVPSRAAARGVRFSGLCCSEKGPKPTAGLFAPIALPEGNPWALSVACLAPLAAWGTSREVCKTAAAGKNALVGGVSALAIRALSEWHSACSYPVGDRADYAVRDTGPRGVVHGCKCSTPT